MFVRKRVVKAKGRNYEYFSIVETVRVDGKPRQHTVYDMGKRASLAECVRDAEQKLAYWQAEDQAKHDMFAAKIGIQPEPDRVAKQRARWQQEIAMLMDLAAKVVGEKIAGDVANCVDVATNRE